MGLLQTEIKNVFEESVIYFSSNLALLAYEGHH